MRSVAFNSTLKSNSYYGNDHKVNGQSIFPGSGVLEIAVVAGQIAAESEIVAIEDVVWSTPVPVDADQQLITTFTLEDECLVFESFSYSANNEKNIHAEGRLLTISQPKETINRISIPTLRSSSDSEKTGSEVYELFSEAGFDYGTTFQTIDWLCCGEGFALSKLNLSSLLQPDFHEYILHPTLVDGAFQTVAGLLNTASSDDTYVPFALGSLELFHPISSNCYAYVQPVNSRDSRPDIKKFSILLVNQSGLVLARMNDFYVHEMVNSQRQNKLSSTRVKKEIVTA